MDLTQHLSPKYYETVEDQIEGIFYEIIFKPILEIIAQTSSQLNQGELLNDKETVIREALRSGSIQYSDGRISGKFNASVGRALRSLGFTFNARTRTYYSNPSIVPNWIKSEAGVYKQVAREAHEAIDKALRYTESALDEIVDRMPIDYDWPFKQIEKRFTPIAESIEISPKLSDSAARKLKAEYSTNMKLYIKQWSEDAILDLRGIIQDNSTMGYRFDNLIDSIKNRYEVSKSKAKFLARQETALFMSNFRKQRFQEAGITHYKWSTAHDERVRDDHKKLNGKIFSYDNPPIVDLHTGRRANPGEDFQCRCVDIPLLKPLSDVITDLEAVGV
jgi:SPP1 gp7 family putative phage head morphogenesis protein